MRGEKISGECHCTCFKEQELTGAYSAGCHLSPPHACPGCQHFSGYHVVEKPIVSGSSEEGNLGEAVECGHDSSAGGAGANLEGNESQPLKRYVMIGKCCHTRDAEDF